MVFITAQYQHLLEAKQVSSSNDFGPSGRSSITQMAFGPDGRLYASTFQGGVISFAYNTITGELSDKRNVISINSIGIAFHNNAMYLSTGYTGNQLIRLRDQDGDGFWGEANETNLNLVEGIPTGYHSANQLQIIGNSLFLGIGTVVPEGSSAPESSYGGSIAWIQDLTQVPDIANAAQLRDNQGYLLQGTDFLTSAQPYTETAPNKLVVYAAGSRNPFGLAADVSGNLWMSNNFSRASSNGNGTFTANPGDLTDADLSDDVHDQLFQVKPKDDYGYLNANWRNNTSAIGAGFFDPSKRAQSKTFDALNTTNFVLHNPADPDGLGPSASANGFDFYKGTTLPFIFYNKAFITRYTANVTESDGGNSLQYKDVVLVDPTTGAVEALATGFNRPIDVLTTELGLLVADFAGGVHLIQRKPIYGTPNDDVIYGGAGNDVIYGADGSDILTDLMGDNFLNGELGNDTLYGGTGTDILLGGEGNDFLNAGDGNDFLYGEAGNDVFVDLSGSNIFTGDAGNDTLLDGAGNSRLYGGDDQDYLDAGAGDDFLSGDAGNDTVVDVLGNNILLGGEGSDRLLAGEGNDALYGGAGDDFLNSGSGQDYMNGGAGNDYMIDDVYGFPNSGDYFFGEDGDDTIISHSNESYLYGGNGNDFLEFRSSSGFLYGEGGDDWLSGVGYLNGGDGNDRLIGRNDSLLIGGAGNDLLWSRGLRSTLYGGSGTNELVGGSAVDYFVYDGANLSGTTLITQNDRITFDSSSYNFGRDYVVLRDLFGALGVASTDVISGGYLQLTQTNLGVTINIDTDGISGSNTAVTLATINQISLNQTIVGVNILV
jgi:Ca2+-binding RTX toxin-like protein